MPSENLQVRLRELPTDAVGAAHFELAQAPMPQLAPGQVVTRTLYLSLDPYMRKRMLDARAGRDALKSGDRMMGRTVSVVHASEDPGFKVGDFVVGWAGWQAFAAEAADVLQRIEPIGGGPLTLYLGPLGRPGITAWLGVVHHGKLQQGETLLVSSAAGAVGVVAGQIAHALGARVVGVAGGSDKCAWLKDKLGFDHAVDYKSADFLSQLERATPDGVDLCFESVGAAVLDAALSRMNKHGRISLCGLLGHYQGGQVPAMANFARLLDRYLTLRGFGIDDHKPLHETARAALLKLWGRGALAHPVAVTQGLQNAPQAFIDMLAGKGFGKHLVQVSS